MGIQNLLPQLKSIMVQRHIGEYSGQRVGIDAYAWMHRASYTCAQELCLGQPTTKWLDWMLGRCELLQRHGVTPLLVFDGGRLPEKDKTEKGRKESRDRSRTRALELLSAGDRQGAYKMFQKAVNITPRHARQLQLELRRKKIDFICAPYEADAQLAYLNTTGAIVSVITEDSDLLVFGCTRVFYKMDSAGYGCEVKLSALSAVSEMRFTGWTHTQFQSMCIFAGCDYLDSLPNVGIKKAHSFIQQHKTYDRVIRRIKLDGKTKVPHEYEKDFERALLTFQHQRVYDPQTKKLVHLTQIEDEVAFQQKWVDTQFLGPDLPDDVACGIAEGRYDPDTHQPFPDPAAISHLSQSQQQHQHQHQHHQHQQQHQQHQHDESQHHFPTRAVVPSFADAISRRSSSHAVAAATSSFSSSSRQPTLSGWSKKHSTVDHHLLPAAAPIEHARRYSSSTHAHVASASASASSSYPYQPYASSMMSKSHHHRDHDHDHDDDNDDDEVNLIAAAAASIPAALKTNFRPPRRMDESTTITSTAAATATAIDGLKDVTNTQPIMPTRRTTSAYFASSQSTSIAAAAAAAASSSSASASSKPLLPATSLLHRTSSSSSTVDRFDRARILDEYSSTGFARNVRRSSSSSSGGGDTYGRRHYQKRNNSMITEYDVDDVDGECNGGIANEEMEAELDMEQQQKQQQQEEEQENDNPQMEDHHHQQHHHHRHSHHRRRSVHIVPRVRHHDNSVTSTIAASAFFSSPPPSSVPRVMCTPPAAAAAAVPITFFSPPPPPPSDATHAAHASISQQSQPFSLSSQPQPLHQQQHRRLVSSGHLSSKYFSAGPRLVVPPPPPPPPSQSFPVASRSTTAAVMIAPIPNAASFLFAPPSVPTPNRSRSFTTSPFGNDDDDDDDEDNEGRIDLEAEDEIQDLNEVDADIEEIQPFRHRRRQQNSVNMVSGVKRTASTMSVDHHHRVSSSGNSSSSSSSSSSINAPTTTKNGWRKKSKRDASPLLLVKSGRLTLQTAPDSSMLIASRTSSAASPPPPPPPPPPSSSSSSSLFTPVRMPPTNAAASAASTSSHDIDIMISPSPPSQSRSQSQSPSQSLSQSPSPSPSPSPHAPSTFARLPPIQPFRPPTFVPHTSSNENQQQQHQHQHQHQQQQQQQSSTSHRTAVRMYDDEDEDEDKDEYYRCYHSTGNYSSQPVDATPTSPSSSPVPSSNLSSSPALSSPSPSPVPPLLISQVYAYSTVGFSSQPSTPDFAAAADDDDQQQEDEDENDENQMRDQESDLQLQSYSEQQQDGEEESIMRQQQRESSKQQQQLYSAVDYQIAVV